MASTAPLAAAGGVAYLMAASSVSSSSNTSTIDDPYSLLIIGGIVGGIIIMLLLFFTIHRFERRRKERAMERRERDLEAQARAGRVNRDEEQAALVRWQKWSAEMASKEAKTVARDVDQEENEGSGKFRRWIWKVTGR